MSEYDNKSHTEGDPEWNKRKFPAIETAALSTQRASTSQDFSVNSPEQSLKRKSDESGYTRTTKETRCESIIPNAAQQVSFSEDSQSEEDNEDEINRLGTPVFDAENEYAASGLKQALHGNIYQLKLLMLFVNRGLQQGYNFRLATEMDAAEKFDDVVFRYADKAGSGTTVCRYLQAKHRQDESRTITTSDLLNKEEGDFSLLKYFVSYRKIKKHPKLKRSKFEDCILCTNIDFDLSDKADRKHEQAKFRVHRDKERALRSEDLTVSEIGLEEVGGFDVILDVKNSSRQSARYKIVVNDRHELHETLRESSDAYLLAKTLAKHVFSKTKMTLRTEIFKFYHIALATHVIDVENKRIFTTFSNNDETLSPEVRRFRKIFGAELLKLMKSQDWNASEEAMKAKIQEEKLELSEYFGQKFKSKESSLTNLKEFSEAFVRLIRKARNDNLIVIDRELYKRNAEEETDEKIIGVNIDKLAECALIVDGKKIQFDPKFFTDSELSDNMQAFKNELKTLLNEEYKDLKKYRFEVKNSPKHWDLLYATSELPDDEVKIKEISEFFKQLTFAVRQPNEVELGRIIQTEIGEDSRFNVLSADLVSNSFQIKMLDWFKEKGKGKGKEGKFFTSKKGTAFFKSMEQKVDNLICSGLSSSYPEELEEYGVEFKDENQQLNDFLNNEDARVLNLIAAGKTLPTSIRVHKTIRKQERYKKDYSLIFMRLRSLRPEKTKELVIRSFESPKRYDLLVIDCDSLNNDDLQMLRKIYEQLCNVVKKKKNSAKKLIFITQEMTESLYAIFQNCKKEFDGVTFNNLRKASQEKLLDKQIINLQGLRERPISFLKLLGFHNMSEDLRDFEDSIDSATLVKLICGEEITLGNGLNTLDEVEDFYIKRTFNQLVFLQEKVLKSQQSSDVFAISGIDVKKSLERLVRDLGQIRSFGDIDWETPQVCKFIVLDNEQATEQFVTVCEKYSSENYNVHWLTRESGKLIWKESRGDIASLLPYGYEFEENHKADKTTDTYLPEDQLADHNEGVEVVVISGSSGMGKSTVLTSLARKMKDKESDTWVIRIDLNDHTKVLERETENKVLSSLDDGVDDRVVDFFVERFVKLDTNFEMMVLKTMMKKNGRVVLLVDGFDEISPDYKEIVINVLRRIKNATGIKKLVVSTRPHMTKALETGLGTFSHTIVPFSNENVIDFLVRFWKKKKVESNMNYAEERNEDRLRMRAEELIKKVGSSIGDPVNKFFSIPLQAKMIAEVYQDPDATLPTKINIVDLYEAFVEIKFRIWYNKKSKADLSNLGMKEIVADNREASLKMHQEFALYTLFSERNLKTLLNEQQKKNLKKHLSRICEGKEKTGIINDKAKFTHRSFAEYFTAIFLINKLKYDDFNPNFRKFIVERILHQREYNVIRAFMNGLLRTTSSSQDSQYEDKASVEGFWRSILQQSRNTFSETIFHIAVGERNGEIIKFFLNRFGEKDLTSQFLNQAKDRTDETALYVAASGQHWEELKLLVEHGGASVNSSNSSDRTPLHEAVYSGNLPMVRWLVENGADVQAESIDGQTPTHWAMLSGDLDILGYLIDKTGVDVNLLLCDPKLSDYPPPVVEWLSEKASMSQDRPSSATSSALKRPRRSRQKVAKNKYTENSKKRRLEAPGNDSRRETQAAPNPEGNYDDISRQETAVLGVKQTLHANTYQLRLLMLFLIRARNEGYTFQFATGKFGDLVLQCEKDTGSEAVCRFLEVKHKQDDSKKISPSDLFNVRDTGFSLRECFISYRRMRKCPELSKRNLKNCIVWTNCDLDLKKLQRADIKFLKVEEPETLLDVKCSRKKSARYKFIINEQSQLYEVLENSSDVYVLAKALAEHVSSGKPLSLKTAIFKLYHTALATEVINVRTEKFFANFIDGKNLSHIVTKFREKFATVYSELIERRGEYLPKEILWGILGEERLKLSSNFGKPKGTSEPSVTNAFPNDTVENGEISDFLDNLVFAVNQPNNVELGDIMMEEIGEDSDLHLLDADLITSSFAQKLENLLEKKGEGNDKAMTFLTPEDGEAVFHSIESEAKTKAYSLMSSRYPKQLSGYGIEFEDKNHKLTDLLVRYFDSSTNMPALKLIATGETLPTAIRVHRIIQNTQRYTRPDSLIFMQHRTLLAQKVKDRVIKAYGSRHRHDLLVIECGSDNNDHLEKLCNELYEIMEQYSAKKLILITTDSDITSKIKFKDYREECGEVSFNNLTQASQQTLLDKPCINFQGDEGTSFKKLLGKRIWNDIVSNKSAEFERLVDPSRLVKLIRGDNITVGNILEELAEMTYCYVNRKINRRVFIKKDILRSEHESDVFVISGINKEDLERLIMHQERIGAFGTMDGNTPQCIILDNERDTEQFGKLCAEYSSKNVHWLENAAENFIWKESRGSIGNLVKYRNADKSYSDNPTNVDSGTSSLRDDQLAENDGESKVIIISGNAGMGKTTLLTHVGIELKQQKSDFWVIGVDLYDFTEVLDEERKRRSFSFGDVHGAVDFFVEKLSNLRTDLEKMMLKIMMKNDGKVALLFDGFNEISPRHEETVIHLLQAIQNSAGVKKLFISTRLHMRKALEAKLGIFSHTMMPFNEVNQKFFLYNFWRRWNSGHTWRQLCELEPRAKNLIKQYAGAADEKMNDFIGIPLQLRMMAEIYQNRETENSEEFSLLQEKVNMVDLYRHFIAVKDRIYRVKTGKEEPEQCGELISKLYGGLSLHALFDAEDLVTWLSQQERRSTDEKTCKIYQAHERLGIITQTVDDKLKFIHRTLAEYFTATFLINLLNHGDHEPEIRKFIVEKILLQPNCNIIRAFLNGLLKKPSSSDRQTNGDAAWKSTLEKSYRESGVTIFHIAAEEGHDEIVKFFLDRFGGSMEIGNFLDNAKDNIGRTALDVAASHQRWKTHDLMVKYGGTSVSCSRSNDGTSQDEIRKW